PSRAVRRDLRTTVTRSDPEFSLVLLEDFLYALYAAVHEARGKGQLEQLAPYLRADVRQRLYSAERPPSEVRTVVIGALRYLEVQGLNGPGKVELTVEFEANYTEVPKGKGAPQTYYAR